MIKFNFSIVRYMAMVGLTVTLFLLASCGDDEKPNLIDPTDANALTKAIVIPSSTVIRGVPPATTNTDGSPRIGDDIDDLVTVQGGKLIIPAYVYDGGSTGFYAQIVGADSYYKITSTKIPGGRSAFGRIKNPVNGRELKPTENETVAFAFDLPANIKPGEFCIAYCVFDAENRVSNVVTRCITVHELGGKKSEFLTSNPWKQVSYRISYSGLNYNYTVGETMTWSYEYDLPCNDDYVTVQVTEENRTDYVYLSFMKNGNLLVESKLYEKYLDGLSSDCSPVYETLNEAVEFKGAWSYTSSNGKLILIANIEEDGEYYQDVVETHVTRSGKNIVFREDFGSGEYTESIWAPKN